MKKILITVIVLILFAMGVNLLVNELDTVEVTPTVMSPISTPTMTSTVEVLEPSPTGTEVSPTSTNYPIPTSTSTVVPTMTPTEIPIIEPTPMGHFFYLIERGDNLWTIADWVYQDGTKYIWICDANKLTHDCSLIHADNVLWIPEYFGE